MAPSILFHPLPFLPYHNSTPFPVIIHTNTPKQAFAALLIDLKPNYVRLSIHPSTGKKKLSFPLVPQKDHFSMTPWHCSTCVNSRTGEFKTAHAQAVKNHYDLIEKDGRAYYFRDKSEVWNWGRDVEFEFFYPGGVRVVAKSGGNGGVGEGNGKEIDGDGEKGIGKEGEGNLGKKPRLGKEEMEKVRLLAKKFKTVVVLGFDV